MQRLLRLVVPLLLFIGVFVGSSAEAAEGGASYPRAHLLELRQAQGSPDIAVIRLLDGPEKGRTVEANVTTLANSGDISVAMYRPGDTVVTTRSLRDGQPTYTVLDIYRLPSAGWLVILVIILAVIFAGWRGLGALLGLALSIMVVAGYIIPQILHGHNPYLSTAVGIAVITLIGIFLAHGFSRRTAIALIGSYLTLLAAVGLSTLVVGGLRLSGIGSESSLLLSQQFPLLSLPGLLLCGLIISLIGILDDITVGQAAVVQELRDANPSLAPAELYRRGLKVGREHIASLINTIVLAYVGSSFLFIVFVAATTLYPLWMTLNSEIVMEEVARSLVGSAALILAVPITTALAAYNLKLPNKRKV